MSTKRDIHRGEVITFTHEPGNGTRYFMVLSEVSDRMLMVTWLKNGDNGGTSFLFSRSAFITVDYIMEKMDLWNEGDAVAILVFLHNEVGVSVRVPPRFDMDTGCWDADCDGGMLR